MNPADQRGPERGMDGAMAGNPVHRGEGRCADDDTKMALAAFGIARMTTMRLTFVNDFNVLR